MSWFLQKKFGKRGFSRRKTNISEVEEINIFRKISSPIAALLCMAILTGSLAGSASAAESVRVSDEMVSIVAEWEGFLSTYTGGYIGYGMSVSASDYPDGITESDARELLRETLDSLAAQCDRFFAARGVTLSQQQLDALASLSYNVGTGWMNDSYRLVRTIVAGGYSANTLASALGVWCHIGTTVSENLARHRSAEAAIFLFGDYSGTGDRFHWVVFDPNGGEVDTDILFYQTGTTYTSLPGAGEGFSGWYREDGTQLSAGEFAEESCAVTAHFGAASVVKTVYSDVNMDNWYAGYVVSLRAAGVVDGFSDGTFRPSGNVTRAQALKLVLLAAGYPEQSATTIGWAGGYYDLAVANGWIDGDSWSDLSQPATRLELAQLACAALGLEVGSTTSPFADTNSAAAAALYRAGIFTGTQDSAGHLNFSPDAAITRAQASAVIWRMTEWRNSHAVTVD
jgi:GH24 family phage-related lysozyme (muramidase)